MQLASCVSWKKRGAFRCNSKNSSPRLHEKFNDPDEDDGDDFVLIEE